MGKKKTDDSDDRVKITHEPRDLSCSLSTKERADAANKLADVLDDIMRLEDDKKTMAADLSAQIKRLSAEVRQLTRQVKEGTATRSVLCELQLNWTKLTATTVRTDSGQVVEERGMTEDEKQLDFDDLD